MDTESCDIVLQKDDKYGWKLKGKGDCKEVLEDIHKKLGEYGRARYQKSDLIDLLVGKRYIPCI